MTSREVAYLRITNQQIAGTLFSQPADLVQWMNCMQAQDYGMAKWAIGCRLRNMCDESVEQDFNDGKILRAHILRPTWHFVCPADIRWLLKLSAPRIKAMSRIYHQKLGIDHATLRQSKKIITKALTRHRRLTREELTSILRMEKINVADGRIGHLLMDAELDALICSAGRTGNKFSYQLLDEVVPVSDLPGHEESIGELAKRYFSSRGPARSLIQPLPAHSAFLLPAFDEYMVAYKDRDNVLDPRFAGECNYGLGPVIIYNGQVAGTWRRAGKKGGMQIEFSHFGGIPSRAKTLAFEQAARRYLAF